MAKKQFRDNDTSGESQSHREDDGASPMWAGFPPATCEDILVCLSIKVYLTGEFLLAGIP